MTSSREARLLRTRHDKATGRAKRQEDLSRGAEHWPELFEDLLRWNPDEDRVDRLERHWLPDIRRGGKEKALPEEALFFLKGWTMEMLAEEKIHEAMVSGGELHALSERMRAIEEEHGIARGEPWWPSQGPDQWEALRRQWQQEVDEIFLETLKEHGETELARMFSEDPEGFDRKMEAGRRHIFGH